MGEITEAELVEIEREAAKAFTGEGAVGGIEVKPALDSLDRPAFDHHFGIDLDRVPMRPGLVLIRLAQELRDASTARCHEESPYVRVMNRADWEKRNGA